MRRFKPLYLAPIFALIALLAWALASPIGASPDDDFHLASIWCANAANTSACEPAAKPYERIVPSEIKNSSCYAYKPTVSAACENKYLAAGSKPTVTTARGSFENNYPPVYYATTSVFVGGNIALSVVLMRLVNIVLLIALTTALFLLLPRSRRPVLIWGWILTTVSLGLFLIASNNPSSWAITGIGSSWIALLGYFETSGRRKIGLGALFAISAVMAAGSRADSALYLVLVVGVVGILTFARTRVYLLSAILPAAAVVMGVYFFLSTQQSAVAATGLTPAGPEIAAAAANVNVITLTFLNLLNVPQLWAGVFGTWNLGWFDTVMPGVVSFAAIVVVVGFVFLGLHSLWWRKVIAVLLIALALWLIPTYVLVKGFNQVGQNVQPRYLLPLIVLFVGVVLLTRGDDRIVLTRGQLIPSIALLVIAQSVALYFDMRRYVSGAHGDGFDLDAHPQWWWNMPIPPMAVWILGSLAYAGLLVVLAREMSRRDAIE